MAEFSPEYEALCRKLALERKLRAGDWFVSWRDPDRFPPPAVSHPSRFKPSVDIGVWSDEDEDEDGASLPDDQKDWRSSSGRWLPLEGDWLRMLEEAGVTEVIIHGERDQYVAMDGANLHDRDLPLRQGTGSTRLEALARLWMAVTGREA